MKSDRIKLNKMLSQAKARRGGYDREVFERMTTEQLRELIAEPPPSDERIREILASVDGLHLLESG